MSYLKDELRDSFDLFEHFDRLDRGEMMALAVKFAGRLYDAGQLYVEYKVPEEFADDPEEPPAFSLRWYSNGMDVNDDI